MRHMSFSMTTEAVRRHEKTITRRLGWWFLEPEELLEAVEQCMGLKKGEHVVPLADIQVVSTRREPLADILAYGAEEMVREGFPKMSALDFIDMFTRHNHCHAWTPVNRIEFRYLLEATP
jgi:hypothetical protein